jgi:hypothetical protein
VTQADIDGILGAYSDRPGHRVSKATLLEVDNWQSGLDDDGIRPRLFRARTAVGFAALATRRLFARHMGYCSYDTYSLVVQRYQPGKTGSFTYSTRGRDGLTGHYWTSDQYAFQRPLHVDGSSKFHFDEQLTQRLMELPPLADTPLFEALTEFNSANTDSQDVPEHVEVVMTKSAFEWLLKINQNAKEFVRALQTSLADLTPEPLIDGPLKDAWQKRFPNAKRPLESWALEFCDLRGASAHGTARKAQRFVWKPHTHLAFTSMLFPLLVKKQLSSAGHWSSTDVDIERLRRIESYLMHDACAHDPVRSAESNPWTELDSEAMFASAARRIWPAATGNVPAD